MYSEKYVHNIPIYKGKLILLLTDDKKYINKYLSWGDKNIYATTCFDNYNNDEGYYVILNLNNKYSKLSQGVIAHEALHVVSFLFLQRGIEYDKINDEPTSYLLQWIVDTINRDIAKYNTKYNTKFLNLK